MKKIQLTDGMPSDIRRQEQIGKTVELIDEIKNVCKKSGLSYVEVNKALYLADKELYLNLIKNPVRKAKTLADELASVELETSLEDSNSEGMNIKNAIDKAMPKGKMITRLTWEQDGCQLYAIPTCTSNGMILHNPSEKKLELKLGLGWQPNAEDLRATDWVIRG